MSISGTEWLIILAVIVLVFGRGRVLQLMGDAGRGLTNFRRGIADPADPGLTDSGLPDSGLPDSGPPPPTPSA